MTTLSPFPSSPSFAGSQVAFSSDRERTSQLLLACHDMIKQPEAEGFAWGGVWTITRHGDNEICSDAFFLPSRSLSPFSPDGTAGHSCGTRRHCDSAPVVGFLSLIIKRNCCGASPPYWPCIVALVRVSLNEIITRCYAILGLKL